MRTTIPRLPAVGLLAVLLLTTSVATAGPITIGSPATGSNSYPFGSHNWYQQVYAASSFPGVLTISGVTFFETLATGGRFTDAVYTLSLSTTSKSVNGLDLTNLNNNVGADSTVVFSGHLSGVPDSSILLGGSGLFVYDPALGNLLLDIQFSSIGRGGSLFLDARYGDSGGLFSRAIVSGTGFDNSGLVTRFEDANSAPVPEPASLLLFGTGVVGLRAWRKRR